MKLIYVEWLDHCSFASSWTELKEIGEISPCNAVTVGYLVKETDKHITVVSTTIDGDLGVGAMCILKSCIKKKRVLKT